MSWLYLALNIGSISIPLLYSFEKKMYFIKYWKLVLLSTSITAVFFLVWDVLFTVNGVWGFNPDYLVGIYLFHLPIEEILFFFCIPYASIFMHYALIHFYPNLKLSAKFTKLLTIGLIALLAIVLCYHYEKSYTLVNYSVVIILLSLSLLRDIGILQRFYITFLGILVPFFIVNGVLTGSWIDEPVVWYNNAKNLSIRLGTIPVEDVGYAFSMLYMSTYLITYFKNKWS